MPAKKRPADRLARATASVTRADLTLRKATETREMRLRALARAFSRVYPDTVSHVGETGYYFPGIDHLEDGGAECYARVLYADPTDILLTRLRAGDRLRILDRSDDDEGDMIHVETVDRRPPIDGWVSIDYVVGTDVPVSE